MNKIAGALGVVMLLGAAVGSVRAAAEPFRAASPEMTIELPRDHGSHPEFETEWWYYTGHLVPRGEDVFTAAKRYGFQLTFFRRASVQKDGTVAQTYLAHAALTDVVRGTFAADSKIAGDALGLAGASSDRLKAWNIDWLSEMVGERHLLMFSLPGDGGTIEVRLIGEDVPAALNGAAGFSRKGSCPGCASMYYSVPAIPLSGHIATSDRVENLSGLGWMDHEYMTNALEKDQVGWDWLSLMLADGRSLMVFRIRDRSGHGAHQSGTAIVSGKTIHLESADIILEPASEKWKSPRTGGEYPAGFRVVVPKLSIDTTVRTLVPDQEVSASGESGIAYYEGAVRSSDNRAIGYLEMTGYAKPLDGAL